MLPNSTLKSKTYLSSKGFSLVEIIVTVLLISILSAVAVPRLLSFRDSAGDSAAQSQLTTVAMVARSLFDSSDSFTGVDTKLVDTSSATADRLPEINVVNASGITTPVSGAKSKTVSVAVTGSPAEFIAAAPGGNTSCWFIKLSARSADMFALTTSGPCNADSAPTGSAWQANEFPPSP